MTTTLRFLGILALSAWIGGSFFLMVFSAPAAFRLLPTRELAGTFVGFTLSRLHLLAAVAAIIFLACQAWLLHSAKALLQPAALMVFVMLVLTAGSEFGVTPRMVELRAEMVAANGSIEAAPPASQARQAFARLHAVSAGLELSIFVLGLVVLFITVGQIGVELPLTS
ncbi:MAG TPA: DUF4149 domain-containing protein [Candidatus Acidoferrales bacterium]|nr:DUF4149 domain-containing protein [Candidatus Acidoferrales bacterium]